MEKLNIGAGLSPELIKKIEEFNAELYKEAVEGAEEARKQNIINHRAEIIRLYPREMKRIPTEIATYEGGMDKTLIQITEISLIYVLQYPVLGCCPLRTIIQALNRIGKSIENEPWSSHINLQINSLDLDDMIKMLSEIGISKKFQKELLEKVVNDIDSNIGVSVETLRAREKLDIDINCEEMLKMADIAWMTSPLWTVNTYTALRNFGFDIDFDNKGRNHVLQVYEKSGNNIGKAKKKAEKLGII